MVMSCAAYGCSNRVKKGETISFHRFPINPVLCKQWIIATKREDFQPSQYSKLCSDHFTPEDFVINFGKKSLKPYVVPSIFNFSNHPRKKPRNRRCTQLKSCNLGKGEALRSESSNLNDVEKSPILYTGKLSISQKRKRNQLVFTSGILNEELEDSKQVKLMWNTAISIIEGQRKTILYLKNKVKHLQNRIRSLKDGEV